MVGKTVFALKDVVIERLKRAGYYRTERVNIRDRLKERSAVPLLQGPEEGQLFSREAIARDPRRPRLSHLERLASSSGTSGRPLVFPQPLSALQKEQAYIDWVWGLAGFTPGARMAVFRGTEVPGLVSRSLNRLLLSGTRLDAAALREYQKALRSFRPQFLHCYPSLLEYLLRFCRSEGLSTDWGVRAVFSGSEAIEETQIKLFDELLGARTVAWYGQSEQVALAVFKGEDEYEFFPGYSDIAFEKVQEGVFEILGRGRLNPVFSGFWYRTGDFCSGYEVRDSETFGVPVVSVTGLKGRSAAQILDCRGQSVPFNQIVFGLHSRDWDFVQRYCFVQTAEGELYCVFSLREENAVSARKIEDMLGNLRERTHRIARLRFFRVEPVFWENCRKWSYFYGDSNEFERRFLVNWRDFVARSVEVL